MFTFIDLNHHKREIELLKSDLVSCYRSMASGATLPLPSALTDLKEIQSIIGGVRNQSRNTSLGMILSKPSNNSFFVGTAWEDLADNGQHDEDLFLFKEVNTNKFEFERMQPVDVKKRYPLWDGYHHGDKSYLK